MSSSALLPGDRLEAAVVRDAERMGHAVRVVLHTDHRDALGAGEALRQRVVAVRAQLDELAVLDRRHEAAERLADPAVGDVLLGGHGRREAPVRWAGASAGILYGASSSDPTPSAQQLPLDVRGVSPV